MNIQETSLISDAKKIASITQHYYKVNNRNPQRETPESTFSTRIATLKKQLFTIQSNISERQTFHEALNDVSREMVKLKDNYNPGGLEQFYQNVSKINQTYRYNDETIMTRHYLDDLYERNIRYEDIDGFHNSLKGNIQELKAQIQSETVELRKIQISAENIMSLSTADNDFFNNLKADLDNTHMDIKRNIHHLKSADEIDHLLKVQR
ncbi:MAG: hypothetical protein OEZ36_12240 [Spirochaetota bacterium]|nr:hypothetical protein [Spirochaetota bacterium]